MKTCKKCGTELKENENTCPKCGTKQEISKTPLIIGILAVLILFTAIAVVLVYRNNQTTASVEIGDNTAEFSTEVIGSDNLVSMSNNELTIDFNGSKVSITSSGSLTQAEKADNINSFNQNLANKGDSYDFLKFDDSEPVFATEKVGNDTFRKMYVKNEGFDVRKPVLSGYSLADLSQAKLVDIGKTKKEILGTVYFDYGYANWPKNAVLKTRKTILGRIDFNEVRYAETITALKALLSEIPQSIMDSTVFYVDGHADHTSPHDFNQTLSEARAECVKEILVRSFGIKAKNVITKGYSWDRLAVNTLEECAENRRVEISVLFFN